MIRFDQTDSAKVKVTLAQTGRITVQLLEAVSESVEIEIKKDIDLVLDGKGLTFTEDGCLNFAAGTDCTICGDVEGSSIEKTIVAEAAGRYLIKTNGDHLRITGGSYQIGGYYLEGFMAVRATSDCKLLEIMDCQVSAVHEGEETDTGVRTIQTEAAETVVKNAMIIAQAKPYAQGVSSMGYISIDDSTITASSVSGKTRAVYGVEGEMVIDTSTISASAVDSEPSAVWMRGDSLVIYGSSLNTSSDNSGTNTVYGNCELMTVENCVIDAVTCAETAGTACGIYVCSSCTLKAKDTRILADAKGASAERGPMSLAIFNCGTAFLKDLSLNGTHSGVQNNGKIYVSGGTYTGYCHGGFYFAHGPEGEAFVNDATLRGGCYEGIFDTYYPQNVRYSALYIGGGSEENSSNMTAYLDGCIVDGTDANTSIVVRGSSGEQNNTLNVSNCTLVDTAKWIRVDNDTLRINIGMGGNITAASLKYVEVDPETDQEVPIDYVERGRAVFNNELYRRHHVGHICDGRDYAALMALVEAKLVV